MASTSYLGEFVDYDLETSELTIRIGFITPEEQAKLELAVLEKQQHKFTHKVASKTSVSLQQQKSWYGSLRTIALAAEILPSSEVMSQFDIEMRKAHFPSREIDLSGLDRNNEFPLLSPKQMREMTHEEMGNAIDSLHRVYDFIDWSEYVQK